MIRTLLLTLFIVSTLAIRVEPQVEAVQGLLQRVLGEVITMLQLLFLEISRQVWISYCRKDQSSQRFLCYPQDSTNWFCTNWWYYWSCHLTWFVHVSTHKHSRLIGIWSITASPLSVGVRMEQVTTWISPILFLKCVRIGNRRYSLWMILIFSWALNTVTTWTCAHSVIRMLTGTGSDGSARLTGWLWTASTCLWPLLGMSWLIDVMVSQEYIFYQVYKKLGLSDEGIMAHFTGLHFQVGVSWYAEEQPWNRMGNIKGWANPISLTFMKNEILLNKQVWLCIWVDARLLSAKLPWVCFLSFPPLLVMFLMSWLFYYIQSVICRRSTLMSLTPFLPHGPTLKLLMVTYGFIW